MNKAFPGLGAALAVLGLALAAQAGVSTVLAQVWTATPGNLILRAGAANLLSLGSVTAAAYLWSRRGPAFGIPREASLGFGLAAVLTVLGATVVLGEVTNLTSWILPLPVGLADLFNRLSGGPLAVSLFTLALVAPLTEELLFRGLLLRGFTQRYGPGPALVLSSALFALFHLNPWQAGAAFVAGLYLGWLFQATGSLWYPLAAHGLFNGVPVVAGALGLRVTGYNTPLVPGTFDFQPPTWTAAGAVILVTGLLLTKRWAPQVRSPLSPWSVSDTVEP